MVDAQVFKKYDKTSLDDIAFTCGGILLDEEDGVEVDPQFRVIHKNGYRISHVRKNKIVLIGQTPRTRSLIFEGKVNTLKTRYNLTYVEAKHLHNACTFTSRFFKSLAYNDQIIRTLTNHREDSFWHHINTDNLHESNELYPALKHLSHIQIKTLLYLWLYVTYIPHSKGETSC